MKEWILSVGAVSVISVLIGVIVPEGKTGKLIKWLCSVAVILTVFSPIKSIINSENSFSYDNSATFSPDENYLYFTVEKRINSKEKECENIFSDNGVSGAEVSIEYSVTDNYSYDIKKVVINLENSVMNSEGEHIVIIEKCIKAVSEHLNIEKEAVILNG